MEGAPNVAEPTRIRQILARSRGNSRSTGEMPKGAAKINS